MKSPLYALALAFSLSLGISAVHAADAQTPKKEPSPAQKAQREKMKTCNTEAREKALKGTERQAFMKECLSSGKPKGAPETGRGGRKPRNPDAEKATG